jgi:hypothetical protein
VEWPQEEWQSDLLQRLEDRARQRLWEAGVPITQSTDKDGNRPRMVFTVTLSRAENATPVRVDVAVHQRVRLSRDEAKELELATWSQSGIGGPMVTAKMVLDVFDGEVAQFLKSYREVNQASSPVSTKPIVDTSAQFSSPPNGFEGLNGTSVFVSTRRDLFFNGRLPVDDKFLQEAVETRLKEAGIKVLRYTNEAEQTGHALLYIWVKLSKPNVHAWAPPIGVESTFSQRVRLVRDPKKETDAVMWESRDQGEFVKNSSGELGITDDAVLEVINRQLDEFIHAFKAARPPRRSR